MRRSIIHHSQVFVSTWLQIYRRGRRIISRESWNAACRCRRSKTAPSIPNIAPNLNVRTQPFPTCYYLLKLPPISFISTLQTATMMFNFKSSSPCSPSPSGLALPRVRLNRKETVVGTETTPTALPPEALLQLRQRP